MEKKKNDFFQLLRGICIIAVVMIHSLTMDSNENNMVNIAIRTIINFAVPVFFFISGYFVNKKKMNDNKKKYVTERIKRLIIPFVIYSIIYTIIKYIKTGEFNPISLILGKNASQLYFILVLLQLTIITPLLANKVIPHKKITILAISITPIYMIINFAINVIFNKTIPMYSSWLMGWIAYYVIGMYTKENNTTLNKIKMNKMIIIEILVLIINIIINILGYNYTQNYSYFTSQIKLTNFIYNIILICIIIKIRNIKTKENSGIAKIGNISYGIYYIHMIFIIIIRNISYIEQMNYYLKTGIVFLGTMICSSIIISLIKKITKNKLNKFIGF